MQYDTPKSVKKKRLSGFPEIKYKLKIYTTYSIDKHEGISIDTLDSTYGRGTTTGDKTTRHTSLKFHESQHGGFALSFLNINPVPVLELEKGLEQDEVEKRILKLFQDFNSYIDKFNYHVLYDVDCPGEPNQKICPAPTEPQ